MTDSTANSTTPALRPFPWVYVAHTRPKLLKHVTRLSLENADLRRKLERHQRDFEAFKRKAGVKV